MFANERPSMGWIGVDLDGTLANYYSGDYIHHKIGEPIVPMVNRVKKWLAAGVEVRIVTARAAGDQNGAEARLFFEAMDKWCMEVFGQTLPVTCQKDYAMIVLFDDRAISIEKNTGRITSELSAEVKAALLLD